MAPRQLRSKLYVPPGGWRFVDPDTGFVFDKGYQTFYELGDHVHIYRQQNELSPLPEIEIECWLCEQPNMERYCVDMPRSFSQTIRGGLAAAKIKASGSAGFVDQKTAEARAAVCLGCSQNQPSRKDSRFKRYTDAYMRSIVGDRKTSADEKLFSCTVCSCVLRAKVHIGDQIIRSSLSKKEWDILKGGVKSVDGDETIHCWQVFPLDKK